MSSTSTFTRFRRTDKHTRKIAFLVFVAIVACGLLMVAFYGIYSPSITITPTEISLAPSQTQSFSAIVANKSSTGITWSLSPTIGKITTAGFYTAPSWFESTQTVTVTASSSTDATNVTHAMIFLTPSVPTTFFGLSVLNFTKLNPSMPFGTTRSWDAGPGLDWAEANPSEGVYNFTPLDQFIAFNQSRGAQGVYTFGRTPRWASSQPNNPSSLYGPGQCAPPSSMSYWDAYVTAVVTHAAGRIKYWELWNEPNEASYCGDTPTMVTMAQHAYQIIKKIDPTALILSPAADKASGPEWLAAFLSTGGSKAVDIIAFHGYWSARAEDIAIAVAAYRAVMATNGLSSLPLWDTEASWAYTSTMSLPKASEQASYIAKSYLLHWSLGVARFSWYAYDADSPWGTLYTNATGETAAALAYRETYQWMVGATLKAPCSEAANNVWTCLLSGPDGRNSEAVWISNSSAKFSVPKQYKQYVDLAGVTHTITNETVTIGDAPILLRTASSL